MDEMDDFFGNDDLDREPSPFGEEAIEDNTGEEGGKRVVAPKLLKLKKASTRLALNENMLTGKKGLPALRETFKDFKLNPKDDPYANLDKLMKKYAYWGHLMFPKMKTEDVLSRVETLGTRRQVKVHMMKHRMGMDGDHLEEEEEKKKSQGKDAIIDDGAEDDEPMDQADVFDDDNDDDQSSNVPLKKKADPPPMSQEKPSESDDQPTNYEEDEAYQAMEEERQREEQEAKDGDAEDELLADFDLNNDW